ncbi:hypothetical protein GQ457_07G031580 [Hibiscus cannabinus]
MDRNPIRRQLAIMRQSLFDQGYLDEQFIELEQLQDDANPNFVEEVVTLYFRDSARLILNIHHALYVHFSPTLFLFLFIHTHKVMILLLFFRERKPFDFKKLDGFMHQFKGSSSSIGANKVKAESTLFREYCRSANAEGCMRAFQQLKKEYATLRKKLEAYFQLARQTGPLETATRPK